ncbi:phosphoribosylformylglycinamidine synthase subunit PurS [Lacticaseibacillus parakribbianus]|uniref:phosphoribosylformylglycinamidine synthase subunit PurS n=1 Tax=Lacticaseibacillus parakribbianus TaxID=2970927 RepID=UPI0021CB22D1|nr:phosphoribosylformylglycinamidine synthase subunit PurS [Lacticaseibacillus parakribbianus]
MYKAEIDVSYKPSVLDPKAAVIQNTLQRLGQTNVQSVVVGKHFVLTLTAADQAAAEAQVDAICDQMLANVNMESYRYTVQAVTA